MNRKEFRNQGKNAKNANSDQSVKKKDRELRKLQQELLMVRLTNKYLLWEIFFVVLLCCCLIDLYTTSSFVQE